MRTVHRQHRRGSIPGVIAALALMASGGTVAVATPEPSPEDAAPMAGSSDFVDDNDPSVQYTGDWRRYDGAPYFAEGGHLSLVGAANPAVTVSWTGGRAEVTGSTDHNNQVHGIAEVTLDGAVVGTIDYSTPGQTYRQVLFDTGDIATGSHTLTIRSLDQHGEYGTGTRISFDALVFGDCLTATADCGWSGPRPTDFVDDADRTVRYTGTWNRYTGSPYFADGARLSVVGAAKPSVTITWTGGQAQVLGSTDHNNQVHGIADVLLDGTDVGDINYSTADQTYQRILFDTGTIASGTHKLTIRARDVSGGGPGTIARISFDALVHGDCLGASLRVCDPLVLAGDDLTDEAFFDALDLDRPGLANVKASVATGAYTTAKRQLADYFKAQDTRAVTLEAPRRPTPEPAYDTTFAEDILDGHIWVAGDDVDNDPVKSGRSSHWYEVANAYWWTGDPEYATAIGTWQRDYLRIQPARNVHVLNVALRSHPQIHAFYAVRDVSYDTVSVDDRIDALKTLLAAARDLQWSHDHPSLRANFTANIATIASNALTKIALTFPEFAESTTWRETGYDGALRAVDDDLFEDGTGVEMATGYSSAPLSMVLGILYLADRFGAPAPDGLTPERMQKLTNAGWYWAHLLYPNGAQPALGDGDANLISEQPFTGGTTYLDGGSITFSGPLPDAYQDILDATPSQQWYTRGMPRADMVRLAADVFDEPGMAAAVNHGPAGQLPVPSREFYFSAQYIQRSGFDPDARYLAFDAGPLGSGHSHQDKLGFDLFAYGRPLISDPGRYSYGTSGDPARWRSWFASTAAHNTIVINGRGQRMRAYVPEVPEPASDWVSDDTFDDATGVYTDGYGDPSPNTIPAVHAREMFFVKPDYWIATDRVTGIANGEVTSMFHFTPGTTTIDAATKRVTFVAEPDESGDTAGVVVAPAGDSWNTVDVAAGTELGPVVGGTWDRMLTRGWYAPLFGDKLAAPQANYVRTGAIPMVTATVMYPFAGGQAPPVSATSLGITRADGTAPAGEAVAIRVTRPGGQDVFVSAPHDGRDRTFAGGATDAARAFVARGTSQQVERFVLLDGTAIQLGATTIVESATPIEHLSGSFEGNTLVLEGTELPSTFRVAAPAQVTRATIGGAPVSATRDGDHLVITR